MVRRDDGAQRKLPQHALVQGFVPLDREADADVRITLRHCLGHLRRAASHQMHPNAWVALMHVCQQGGHQVGVDAFHRGDADRAAPHAAQHVKLTAQPHLVLQHRYHVPGEHFSGGCEPQALRHALEQRGTDFFFQLQQLAIDGRGRDVKPPRGLTDRPAAADHVKVFDGAGMDVHATCTAYWVPTRACAQRSARVVPNQPPD